MAEQQPFKEWCVLEVLGHRRHGGLVTEQVVAGQTFLRIDIPGPTGDIIATQFYAPSSVYCLTPVSEEIARQEAKGARYDPVVQLAIPAQTRRSPVDYETPFPEPEDDPDDDLF